MRVKKSKGGGNKAVLSTSEKQAIDREIRRQLAEYDRKHELEICALVMWQLHEQFGFGKKRLKRFFDGYSNAMDKLVQRYEVEDADMMWDFIKKINGIGVDIEMWYKGFKSNLD